LSTVENIEGAALKRTMPFLFSVDPNVFKRIKVCFFFALLSATKYFLLLSTIKKTYKGLQIKCPVFLSNFNKIWNFWNFFIKISNISFKENLSGGSRVITC